MSSLRKFSGYAALAQLALFVALLILYAVVLPGTNLVAPAAFYDPQTLSKTWPLIAIAALDMPYSVITLLVALALFDKLRAKAPGTLAVATAAGVIATTLLLASSVIGFRGLSILANAPNRQAAGTALPALVGAWSGAEDAGLFALGWWVLLASWAGLRTGGLPRWLNVIGLLAGALYIISVVVPTQPLSPLLATVWFVWLGVILIREE